MLDFYSINDQEGLPEYPNEENYIGSIGLNDFKSVHDLIEYTKTLGVDIGYYIDFRIKKSEVSKMYDFAKVQIKNVPQEKKASYRKFLEILKEATINQNSGLICFCD